MGKMLPSLSLTSVSNFDFGSKCLVVNINIQNQDWQISFSKSKLNIQDYALGCQYQDSNSRFKSCISRLVLNFNICKFAWQYSIPKSKSLQTSNSTSISRILSISTSKSTNINNFAHLCNHQHWAKEHHVTEVVKISTTRGSQKNRALTLTLLLTMSLDRWHASGYWFCWVNLQPP